MRKADPARNNLSTRRSAGLGSTRVLAGLAGLGLLVAALVSWSASSASKVEVVRPLRVDLRHTVVTLGRVHADVTTLGALRPGRVRSVLVRQGDVVDPGQLLVTLEDEGAQAQVARALALLAQAEAQQGSVIKVQARDAHAQLAAAQTRHRDAEATVERLRALRAASAIEATRLSQAELALELSEEALRRARLQTVAAGKGGPIRALSVAQIAAAKADLSSAEAALADCSLRAPVGGVIVAREVEVGDVVTVGSTLLELVRLPIDEVLVELDERHLASVQPGQSALVSPEAYPALQLEARVTSIAPRLAASTGTIEVRLQLDATQTRLLKPEMTVSVDILVAERAQVLTVPAVALRTDAQGSYVLVLEDGDVEGRARRYPVQEGLGDGERVELIGSLPADAAVLVGEVEAGDRVKAAFPPRSAP